MTCIKDIDYQSNYKSRGLVSERLGWLYVDFQSKNLHI